MVPFPAFTITTPRRLVLVCLFAAFVVQGCGKPSHSTAAIHAAPAANPSSAENPRPTHISPTTPFDIHQQQGVEKNPPGIEFLLSIADGKTQYRCGEVIKAEFTFKNLSKEQCRVMMSAPDRENMHSSDRFHCNRSDGAIDPFYSQGVNTWPEISSDPPAYHTPLGSNPEKTDDIELNQWLAFDKPGAYRIYALTQRVMFENKVSDQFKDFTRDMSDTRPDPGFPLLTSNVISLTILPADEKWKRLTYDNARNKLQSANESDHYAGIKALRYLRTREAALELMRQCGNEGNYTTNRSSHECEEALLESPYRAMLVGEMERRIADPTASINISFIDILVKLHYYLEHPAPKLSEPRSKRHEKYETGSWDTDRGSYKTHIFRLLATAAPHKKFAVHALCVETLMALADQEQDKAWMAKLKIDRDHWVDVLLPIYTKLPIEDQQELLERDNYYFTRDLKIVPVLQKIHARLIQKEYLKFGFKNQEFLRIVEQRLKELAPERFPAWHRSQPSPQ